MQIFIKKAEVVNYDPYKNYDPYSYITGPLIKRDHIDLSFHPLTKEIKGSENLIISPEDRTSCLYYDDEAVYKFKNYYFLNLACQPSNEPFYYKSKMKVNCVVIDKVNHMLYILKNQNELYKFLSGKEFEYIYYKRLNSFTNVSLATIKKGRNETYRNTKQKCDLIYDEEQGRYKQSNPLDLFQVKLIHNLQGDVNIYNTNASFVNTAKYFNIDIPIYSCYKFLSAHETKIRTFQDIIQEVTGYKIIY